jgi:hypothetical protein
MLQLTDRKCACCCESANGFVCTTQFLPPGRMQLGASIDIQRTFPACKRTECNHKLRDYVAELQNVSEESILISCEHCKKAEERQEGDPSFPFALVAKFGTVRVYPPFQPW